VATEHADAVWVTESQEYSLAELVSLSGLPEAELRALVEYGAIRPADPEAASWVFSGQCLLSVRAAQRIRDSFELEPHGLALVISLLERIRDLEARLDQVYAQKPRQAL
jgi:chaperone modulatory protein CbpM